MNNNFVAKHARTFNKSHVFRDRTKYQRSNSVDLDEWYESQEEEDWFWTVSEEE